jgi:hypothetical protein
LTNPRREAELDTSQVVTMGDMLQLLAKMNEDNQKNMMAMVAEMKKPTEREQKELDVKEAKLVQQQATRLKMAQAEEQRKEMQRKSCAHGTTHGGTGVTTHQWRGQVMTPSHCDPYFLPRCTQCNTALKPIRASAEMMTQGVNLNMYAGLNIPILEQWADVSWKGHEDRHPSGNYAKAS